MKIGILTRNENAWCSARLGEAFKKKGVFPFFFNFNQLTTQVGFQPPFLIKGVDPLKELSSLLVRPIGRGSLEEIIFQINTLHRLYSKGLNVINKPSAIEKAVDKYYALALLEDSGIPIPKTIVTENPEEALLAFKKFKDIVVKPMFGSRGIGIARISNLDIAERSFRTLRFFKHVIYVQEYIHHGVKDLRAFIIDGKVIAAMYRIASTWKTNVSLGAKPVKAKLSKEAEELAVKAAEALGCEIAGVDLLESNKGLIVNEVNSQPGWRGLQKTTKVDIASEIANYVISKAKR
ncbi:MAG: RimK family alpha-L-glutamate ligase [Candidatus Bathyarchaeia archaeon]